jgi:hypothetical protein
MQRVSALLCALSLVAGACGGTETTSTIGPVTTSGQEDDGPTLIIEPSQYSQVMAGQRCVLLVSVEGSPATVTAAVNGPATVEPAVRDVDPGQVVEYTVIPTSQARAGTAVELELTAERNGYRDTATMSMEVVDWVDDLEPLATELRNRFVAYLATNRPELGITSATTWTPTITKPQILVVMHYLFFSEDWEMGITWHVTVPEHAWSRMYLRHRDQFEPSIGLEIPSYLDPASLPIPWEPPLDADR